MYLMWILSWCLSEGLCHQQVTQVLLFVCVCVHVLAYASFLGLFLLIFNNLQSTNRPYEEQRLVLMWGSPIFNL